MSSYIIQGSSDSDDLAKIECFIKRIEEIDSSVDFKVVIEDCKTWKSHIRKICCSYGFKTEFNPIIYKNNGDLMGDYQTFKEWVLNNYQLDEAMVLDTTYRNSAINQQLTTEQLNLKAKIAQGTASLNEQIVMKMQNMLDSGALKRIEGFFTQQTLNNVVYHYKEDESLCVNYQVPMGVESDFLIQKEEPDNFDMNKVFLKDSQNEDSVNKKMARGLNKLNAGVQLGTMIKIVQVEKEKKEEMEKKEEEKKEEEKKKDEEKKDEEKKDEEKKDDEKKDEEKKDEEKKDEENKEEEKVEEKAEETEEELENMPDGFDSALEKSSDCQDYNQPTTTEQISSPNQTFQRTSEISLKQGLVKELPKGYALVINQNPQVYGQCLLVHNQGHMEMTDNSCQKKRRINISKNKSDDDEFFISKLNEQQVNVFAPLSLTDLEVLLDVNQQIDGVAFYQVLPRNAVNLFAQQSQVLHVVPQFLLSESLANRGLTRLRDFQLSDQLELFNYQPSRFPTQLAENAKTVYYPAQQQYKRQINRKKIKPVEVIKTAEDEEQKEQKEQKEDLILNDKELKEEVIEQGEQEIKEEGKKKKRIIKRKLRERSIFHYNPCLPHKHLFYESVTPLTPSSSLCLIREMMMCFLKNYNIDVTRVGINYILSTHLIYISIINQPVYTHGTYQVYPLPMYFYAILNYPSFNHLWPSTSQPTSTLNSYQLLQQTQ